jgi:hypothetical protein
MRPFRWSIAKREQLGTFIETARPANLHRHNFLSNLRETSARIIAFADNADIAFIGRTPENFFDYLSGIFSGVADAPAVHLVHFSLRWAGPKGVRGIEPAKVAGFFDYLVETGLDAASIARADNPLALVDFIASGGTMQSFVQLLQLQAEHTGVDWNAVQRRLRIIGLRARTHNSPNTRRWQQHQDWLHLIPNAVIKNVSAPAHLLYHLANDQPKVARPFHPDRWDADDFNDGPVTDEQMQAIGLAVRLYDTGLEREERLRLARLIAQTHEMRQPATRRLVSRIKGK